jgi:hypothetical protein
MPAASVPLQQRVEALEAGRIDRTDYRQRGVRRDGARQMSRRAGAADDHFRLRCSAVAAYLADFSGVRWADMMRVS